MSPMNIDASKFVTMTHQVGGHATEKTSLRSHGGQILKPFQSKRRGEREHEFYQHIFKSDANIQCIQLRTFLPHYHGVVIVEDPKDGDERISTLHSGQYLVLSDLTWNRSWPCIMDVKIGTKSYDHDASDEKIAYEQQKFPLQPQVGFRVQGIKTFDPQQQSYIEYDKHFGRDIQSTEDLVPVFSKFFIHTDRKKSISLLQSFISRLEEIKNWFENQHEFEFIASSLLFLYNGEGEIVDPDIRLIDFAHVHYNTEPRRDQGVLLGISTLITTFRKLLKFQHQ